MINGMSTNPTNPTRSDSEWPVCPAGTLGRLNARLDRADRYRRLPALATISAIVPLLMAVPFLSEALVPPSPKLPLVCADVAKVSDAYVQDKVDSELRQQIQDHIQWCDRCSREIATLRAAHAAETGMHEELKSSKPTACNCGHHHAPLAAVGLPGTR